jgi:hypothetical protein
MSATRCKMIRRRSRTRSPMEYTDVSRKVLARICLLSAKFEGGLSYLSFPVRWTGMAAAYLIQTNLWAVGSTTIITGDIDIYHACRPGPYNLMGSLEKASSHLCKSYGFYLVAEGEENICNQGFGPHKIRLLKANGDLQL